MGLRGQDAVSKSRKSKVIILLLIVVLTSASSVEVWGELPGYENVVRSYKIADYTVEVRRPDGRQLIRTFPVYNSTIYTDDEMIEASLKSCWTMNESELYRITHVNGKPIEQTKWAKYGGVIQHIEGNFQFPDDPVQPTPVATEVTVFINGKQVEFPDQKAIIILGRTMVPMRAVFEHPDVQAEVIWNAEERTVTATDRSGKTMVFRIGENNYRVKSGLKEELKYSDVAPIIQNNRALLPLRALSESLDFKVDWIGEEKKVEIKEKPGNKRKLLSSEEWAAYLKKGGNA
jgi:hypothetical protein